MRQLIDGFFNVSWILSQAREYELRDIVNLMPRDGSNDNGDVYAVHDNKSAFDYLTSSPPGTGHSLRLIWHQTLDPRTPFHSKWIRQRTRYPGLFWTQLMVPNLCSRTWQPFCSYFQKRVNPLFNSFTACCLSFHCNCVLLFE